MDGVQYPLLGGIFNAVRARFDDGVKERLAVIADLKRKPSTENQLLFETLKSSDPSPAIRAAVR